MDIKVLLQQPESKVLEFKRNLSSLKPIFADNILPQHLFPEFEYYTIDKRNLLIVRVHHIPESFYLKQEGDINGVYIRLAATSRLCWKYKSRVY